jgi:hypothetical protein
MTTDETGQSLAVRTTGCARTTVVHATLARWTIGIGFAFDVLLTGPGGQTLVTGRALGIRGATRLLTDPVDAELRSGAVVVSGAGTVVALSRPLFATCPD